MIVSNFSFGVSEALKKQVDRGDRDLSNGGEKKKIGAREGSLLQNQSEAILPPKKYLYFGRPQPPSHACAAAAVLQLLLNHVLRSRPGGELLVPGRQEAVVEGM